MKDKRKNIFRKKVIHACRASVSVLLSILLLPILALIGAMVDHANINLSRSMVENAGELTVNAALANYDTVVKDVYGLFAMSQTYDDLSNNLEEYFVNTLSAYGLIDEANPHASGVMNTISAELKDFFGTITTDDINAGVIDINYKNFNAEAIKKSALTNPDVLRNQIVEFMKYRGPAEVGLDLLDSLNVFRAASNKVDVTNAKTDLDEATANAADITQEFYACIEEFNKLVADIQVQEIGITDGKWTLIETKARTANEKIYLYATMVDLEDEDIYYLTTDKEGYYIFDYDRLGKKNDFKSSAFSFSFTYASTINSLIADVKKYNTGQPKTATQEEIIGMTQILNGLRNELNVTGEVDKADVVDAIYSYNQLMMSVRTLTNYGLGLKSAIAGYNTEISNYNTEIGKLDTAINTTLPEKIADLEDKIEKEKDEKNPNADKISGWEADIDELEAEIEQKEGEKSTLVGERDLTQGLLNSATSLSSSVQSALSAVSSGACAAMKSFDTVYTAKVEGAVSEATANMKYIYDLLHPYYESVNALLTKTTKSGWWDFFNNPPYLDYMLKVGEKVKDEIGKVNAKAAQLDAKAEDYAKKESKDEYYQLMKSEAAAAKAQYTVEDVNEVIAQIKAVKEYLNNGYDGVFTQLTASVYNEKFIEKGSFDSAKYICKSAKKIVTDSMTIDYCFDTYFNSMVKKKLFTKFQYLKRINQAGIQFYEGGVLNTKETINVPKFYLYLVSTYGTTKSEDKKENGDNVLESTSKINDQVKDETSETESLSDGITYEVFNGLSGGGGKDDTGNDAMDGVADGFGEMESSVGGILGQFRSMTNLAKGLFGTLTKGFENARDNLLVTTYLFENFSYATIEAEPKQKGEKPELKTLTNVDISKNNNALYGCELEYILYGYRGEEKKSGFWLWKTTSVTGPSENIKIVQGNIFSIRFLMNSLFAITDKQLNAQTLPPAMAIQAASAGFFPYKVAQIVLDICLALTESLMDVDDLMAGKEVPLMKTYQTWQCSMSGMVNMVKEEVVEKVALEARRLAEEGYDALVNGLQDLVESGVEYAVEKVNDLATNAVVNLENSVKAKMDEIIATASQAIMNAVGETFSELFSSTHTFDVTQIKDKVTSKVMAVLGDSSFGPKVKELLEGKAGSPGLLDKMIDYVLNTQFSAPEGASAVLQKLNGKSVISLLEEYHINVNNSTATDGTITVTNTMYTDLIQMVQEKTDEYIETTSETIQNTVKSWTSDAGAMVEQYATDAIKEWGDANKDKVMSIAQEKIDGIKNTVNGKLDELFPASGDKGNVKMLDGASGTGKKSVMDNALVSTVLSFTYMDYLRLFVFLGLSGDDGDNILKRTAEVMELNIRSGLTDYYKGSDSPAKHPADNFAMKRAYTYVTMDATIGVKPLLMSRKLFREPDSSKKVIRYWTYDYSTVAGY